MHRERNNWASIHMHTVRTEGYGRICRICLFCETCGYVSGHIQCSNRDLAHNESGVKLIGFAFNFLKA